MSGFLLTGNSPSTKGNLGNGFFTRRSPGFDLIGGNGFNCVIGVVSAIVVLVAVMVAGVFAIIRGVEEVGYSFAGGEGGVSLSSSVREVRRSAMILDCFLNNKNIKKRQKKK